jgi:plastocyanin
MDTWSKLALAAALIAGCGKSDSSPAPPRPVAMGAGIIHGVVFFDAPAPAPKLVSPPGYWSTDYDEAVVLNSNGTLRNVMIYLKDAPPGDGGGPPVVLDQRDAHYIPHVICLQVGQPLIVRNSDAHFHNVSIGSAVNPPQNFPMADTGDHDPITFKAPEFFKINCNVHPWMDAEVGVFDHPYFAVTGDDGSFTIGNLPPGQYTLVARHERYGDLTQAITVADRQTLEVTFRYREP